MEHRSAIAKNESACNPVARVQHSLFQATVNRVSQAGLEGKHFREIERQLENWHLRQRQAYFFFRYSAAWRFLPKT
jgi:CRISPR/Cas system-associated endoribonuclease Cas2